MSSRPQQRSPYQGLIPYGEDDAPFFFGREKETRLIIANLFASSLTLLYGASGVGKSSVLRAGVAHQLRQRDDVFVVVFNAWQGDPINDLKARIAVIAGLRDRSMRRPEEPVSLADFLTTYANKLDRRLMIILDQFEEYFLYHPQEDAFAEEFARALRQSDNQCSFLISIREDFYAKLDRFEGRIPTLYDNYFRIEHLDRKAAREAIEKPIEQFNGSLSANTGSVALEPALVEAVLKQVETGQVVIGEAGRGTVGSTRPQEDAQARIETPFLQLVMTRLWDEEMAAGSNILRLATLERLGGAESIVRTHLDAVMSAQQPQDQDVASGIFHYLVTPSGTKIAYTASDLAQQAELDKAQVVRVLEKLAHGDVRILRPVDPPLDQPSALRYEIFHDVLAPAVLSWCAAHVQRKRRVAAEARAREQEQRANEQARVARRLRLLVAAMTVMFLLALCTAAYAFTQRRQAQAKAIELQKKAIELEKARTVAVKEQERANQETERATQNEQRAVKNERAATVAGEKAETQRKRADEQAQLAHSRETEAVRAREQTLAALKTTEQQQRIAQSRELAASGLGQLRFDPELSMLLGMKAAEVSPTEQAEDVLRRALLESHERALLADDTGPVNSAAFSPDGNYIVTGSDKSALVWNANTGQRVAELPEVSGALKSIAFSSDSKLVLAQEAVGEKGQDETSQIWQAGSWRNLPLPHVGNERQIQMFSPDGKLAVVIGTTTGSRRGRTYSVRANTAFVYEIGKTNVLAELKGHTDSIRSVSFTPDGRYVLTTSDDRTARVWEVNTGHGVILGDKDEQVFSAHLSPDGKYVVTSNSSGVHSWETNTGRKVNELSGEFDSDAENDRIFSHAFSRDNRIILVAKDRTSEYGIQVRAWPARGGDPGVTKIRASILRHATFSPDGKVVLLIGDYTAWLWNTDQPYASELQGGKLSSFAFSPDGKLVLTINEDKNVRIWRTEGGQIVGEPLKHGDPVDYAAFSPNGKLIVTTSRDQIARVWEAHSGKLVAELRGHKEKLNNAAFSPDGKSVLTASDDHTARLWDVGMEQSLLELHQQLNGIYGYVFSTDGQFILTGAGDNSVQRWQVSTGHPTFSQRGPAGPVHTAALSPDGKRAVTATDDSAVRLWETQTGRNVSVLRGHTQHVQSVAFSQDGRYLLTAGNDGTARVWETSTGHSSIVLKNESERLTLAAFSADAKSIVTVSNQRQVRVWETSTGNKLAVLSPQAQAGDVDNAVISPDGRFVITTNDHDALLWDLTTVSGAEKVLEKPTKEMHAGNNVDDRPVWNAAFSPDGKFAAVTGGAIAHIWQVNPARQLFVLQIPNQGSQVSSAEFSFDGRLIVTAGPGNAAHIWDARTGQHVRQLSGHADAVLRATFSPDGNFVVTASNDKTARVWAIQTGETVAILRGHEGKVTDAVFTSDGTRVFTISAALHARDFYHTANESDQTARVWEAGTGRSLTVLPASVAAISPDGKLIVNASADDTAWVWDTQTGRTIAEIRGHQRQVSSIAFSPDGKLVATGNLAGTAWVWDADTGRQVSVVQQIGAVQSLAFSPDSKLIVTSSGYVYKSGSAENSDDTARVWEASTGQSVATMRGHTDILNGAAFSPNGRYVVTTSRDKTARVWDTSTGRQVGELSGHPTSVSTAAFSHNGRYIVTASEDGTVRVWSASGAPISQLIGHRGEINSASFSYNDKFVVTAGRDGTARIWQTNSGESIAELLGHTDPVQQAIFSPDNKFVITWNGYVDIATRVFACEVCGSLDDLQKAAARRVKRELTPDEKEKYLHVALKR